MKTLIQLFDDIHAIRFFLTSGPITAQLCEEDRELLKNYRRNKPRAKNNQQVQS